MKSNWKFIGIDLGAESGRCYAAIFEDQKITLNEVHRFTTHTLKSENGLHWDVQAIFAEIVEALSKTGKLFGPDFDGIAVDTWGVDYVLINSDGGVISYPYHYRDNRTEGIMEEAYKIISKEQIYYRTGVLSAQYNTLFQLLSEKKEKLNLLSIADKMLMMPDFFNFMLSGEKKTEYSIASTTNLCDPYKRNWSEELFDLFELPKTIFPQIIEPGTKLGTLLPRIVNMTALCNNIAVFASAGHDTASAVAAIPFFEKNRVFISSGTWSLMGIELQKPLLNNEAMKYNFTNEGGINGTTLFLKNIIGLWPLQECKRSWQEEGCNYSYKQLTSLAKAQGFVNAWIDLDNPEFLKPGNMPGKIIAYLRETNQVNKDGKGFIVGVILESLAFSYRKTLKEVNEITGENIEMLHVTGGGIQNELLSQYIADATGLPVCTGPVEGAIIGNVGVQAIAAGAVPGIEEWRKIVANSFTIKIYNPIDNDYFNGNEKNYESVLGGSKCFNELVKNKGK